MDARFSELAEPFLQQLAKTLGVPELRSGLHTLRRHGGSPDDQIVVDYCWYALVMPSNPPWAAVGLIHTMKSEFRGKKHPTAIRAGAVLFPREHGQVGHSVAADLLNDSLSEVIGAVQLLPGINIAGLSFLDGIGYRICTSCASDYDIEATLEFANPQTASLRAIEEGLFQVAQTVQEQNRNNELADYLAIWRRYIDH
jgi:hypothetical protein